MWKRCEEKKMIGKTITLKLRFSDFTTITRSHTNNLLFTRQEVIETTLSLLPIDEIKAQGIRLLGVTMSNFKSEYQQISGQLKIDF